MAIKNRSQKIRFLMIGGFNTVVDFGILFSLKALGLPAIPANIISTLCAFCISFFANKKYTFKTDNTNIKREIILFIVVTLFGLWVLQGIVIYILTLALAGLELPETLVLLVAKVLATVVSLVWNYTMYSRVVFKHNQRL